MKSKWEHKTLGDICVSELGKTLNQSKDTGTLRPYLCAINIQWDCLNLQDLKKARFEDDELERYSVQKGDLLVCEGGDVGRAALWESDEPMLYQNALHRIRFSVGCYPRFYLFCLRHLKNKGVLDSRFAKGVTIKHLVKSSLLSIPVPVPPLDEQQRIVAELDLLTEVIDKQKTQLKELDTLAQSIFYDMFGDPIENPKGWNVKSYGDCFDIGSGGTPSKSNDAFWNEGDIPWIGSNLCQNCVISHTDGKCITRMGLEHSSTKFLEENTVLVALVGATIGKVGLLKTKTAINQNIAFIRCIWGTSFSPEYVFYQLMGLYPLFMNIGNGDFKMANLSFVRKLPIEIPPFSLQQEFADKITAIEKQKAAVNQSIAETQKLLDYTMDKYFG